MLQPAILRRRALGPEPVSLASSAAPQAAVQRMAKPDDEEQEASASTGPVVQAKRTSDVAPAPSLVQAQRIAAVPPAGSPVQRSPASGGPAGALQPAILRRGALGPLPVQRRAASEAPLPLAAAPLPLATPATPAAPAAPKAQASSGAAQATVQRAAAPAGEEGEKQSPASPSPVVRAKSTSGEAPAPSLVQAKRAAIAPSPASLVSPGSPIGLIRPIGPMSTTSSQAAPPVGSPVQRSLVSAAAAEPGAAGIAASGRSGGALPLPLPVQRATAVPAVASSSPFAGATPVQRALAAGSAGSSPLPGTFPSASSSTSSSASSGSVPGLSAAASGLAMPLARSVQPAPIGGPSGPGRAGLLQRQTSGMGLAGTPAMGGGEGSGASAGGAEGLQPAGSNAGAAETAAPKIDEEEMAERVLRRLLRTLAVEGERRGLRRWP